MTMKESRTVHDAFLGKDVQVSDRLTDRLRGRYAQGPTMPNGEPEFGWREFPAPPIQHEAADLIDQLVARLSAQADVRAATIEWQPTEAQVRSACLSYRHDFGLLTVAEAAVVKSEAREWLRAWQKEGAGANRNEIIEQCARVVDQANREGPYQAIAAASRIRSLSDAKQLEGEYSLDSKDGDA